MKNQDYQKSFSSGVTAKEAFEYVTKVADWWTSSFKGSAINLNDEFNVTFGKTTVDFKVIKSVPYKKLVWQVTDCYLDWLKNKTDWKGTSIVWNITEKNNIATIEMTHKGLVPGIECYKDCESGWNQFVGESLPSLITNGKGILD